MKKRKGDVCWWGKGYKRPIAYSTVADSDTISLLNQPHRTPNELMKMLKSGDYLVSQEVIEVIQVYIDKGFGNEVLVTTTL